MKVTTKDDWHVVATVRPMRTRMSIASLGFKDTWGQPLRGQVWGENFEITAVPDGDGMRMVGDYTFVSNDSGEDGCKQIRDGMLKHPNVIEARIVCTETHTCSHCDLVWEELTAEDAATDRASGDDEHATEGQPLCCGKAIDEFRNERGIPLPKIPT